MKSIYIPSKGRIDNFTGNKLESEQIPFKLFVEPKEYDDYVERWGEHRVINIGVDDKGIVYVRNFILSYARNRGQSWIWMLDDDILEFYTNHNSDKVDFSYALNLGEDIADRYINLGLLGFQSFIWGAFSNKSLSINKNINAVALIRLISGINYWEKLTCQEDIAFCLEYLTQGFCTIRVDSVVYRTLGLGKNKGGMSHLYSREGFFDKDNRNNAMLLALRFGKYIDRVDDRNNLQIAWRKFETPLRRFK